MLVLGIETSCDETAAAVLDGGRKVLGQVVASQDKLHGPYGGVVPELASRRHLEDILPVVRGALGQAGTRLEDLDGIAVTQGPGLVGSLLIGCSVAKALAYVHRLPLVGVNHLEGHIYAAFLEEPSPTYPFLALVVSGGHTALYLARAPRQYERIGQTRDDAAGEAFDKVAKLLGLGYPGGPLIERTAQAGDPRAISFSTAKMSDGAPDFSFSGIKTAVSLHVKRHHPLGESQVADVAASFQATVVKMLVRKTARRGASRGGAPHPPHRRGRRQRRPALGLPGRVRRARLGALRALARPLHRQCRDDRRGRPRAARGGRTRAAHDERDPGPGAGMSGRGPPVPLDYEALIAGLPDAVVGVDDELRIILWNPAAEALLGRSARRVTGRTLKEVFAPETSLVRHLTDTLATGESRSESEATVESADGRTVHVSVMTAPLAGRGGAVDAAVAVVRDISRLHQLEAEVRRGETLAAVGRVAVGLAHEIRNPLGAIRGPSSSSSASWATRRAGANTPRCSSPRSGASTGSSRCSWTWAGPSRSGRCRSISTSSSSASPSSRRRWRRSVACRSTGATTRACRRSWPTRTACSRSSTTSSATPSRPCRTAAA